MTDQGDDDLACDAWFYGEDPLAKKEVEVDEEKLSVHIACSLLWQASIFHPAMKVYSQGRRQLCARGAAL